MRIWWRFSVQIRIISFKNLLNRLLTQKAKYKKYFPFKLYFAALKSSSDLLIQS